MDREPLEQLLEEGLSLAEIGRRFDRHEATVSYWVNKHGLTPANREKHASKGPLERDELERLVVAGMSTTQIAESVGRSKTTVRHWLREYGLTTQWAERRRSSGHREPALELRCSTHGVTTFRRRSQGGYRCVKCRADAVSRRRRKVKRVLVEEAGGCCAICGYKRSVAALHFHHTVPAEKSFSLSHRGVARSLEKARREASKCVLLCSNCHAEVEAGVMTLPTIKEAA
ncbi:MAG: helix-turn-helix domain-containing protein [Solirubrobacteraceae bacterium]